MEDSSNALDVVFEVPPSAAVLTSARKRTTLFAPTKPGVLCTIATVLHALNMLNELDIKKMNSILSKCA